ncbi:Protein unc-45 B [Trichostrongylus colubriformis]|uniref:Protein unc-45 B n=1 Tax=Trichostrongylus colubriformis TaxID=6319 RepID=A0AAN8F924_TRICO
MVAQMESAESLKDAGNDAVKRGEYSEANEYYTEALQLTGEGDKALRALLYRNRSLSRLKQEDFEGAESDATIALEYDGADVKAFYRRAFAREHLDNVAAAFKDAKEALRLNPKDKSISEMLQRLVIANNEKVKKATTMDYKVTDMSKLAFEGLAKDKEQRMQAFNNLLVLARETEAGAARIWNAGKGISVLLAIAENNNEPLKISVCAIRIVDELIKNHGRALLFLSMHDDDGLRSVRRVCRIVCARDAKDYVDAAGLILQRIFNALVKMDRTKEIKPDPEVAEANKLWIIRVILELQSMLKDKSVTAIGREMVIDLLVKNLMHMDGGIPRGWSWKFVEDQGLLCLLDVASQIPEQCDYPVSHETRQHVAICLQRLDDDMVFDTKRLIYKEKVDLFFNSLMARASDDPEGHKVRIKLAALLITLLQGPVDLGVNLVTNDQVTALMLQMAASPNHLMQSVAAELIVMTVVKRERATSVLKVGLPILRKLYDSEDENVKVRALVGLCKCAAAGGDDASRATMKEGAPLKLAHTCKKFLLDYEKYSMDVRRFACEGLSYLSLDADVKEWIVEDSLLLRALFCLAQSAGALCVYTLATIYVNLTNAYEKPQVEEELVKLAQFAKHHVPEVHSKDTDDYVEKRVRCLVEEGAVTACVAISKTESRKAQELLARAMLAFSELEDLRGRIIGEGGTKLCLRLTKEATPEGKIKAAHAIAKLGAKTDPQIAFPGQRAYEVVKPLCDLLHPDIEGKPNYDALLTLTNLVGAAFAILTEDVDANRRIFEEIKSWPEVFKEIAMHEDPEAQRRGLLGIANIMESDEKLCSEVVASELFRVLVAIAKLGAANESRKGAAEEVSEESPRSK